MNIIKTLFFLFVFIFCSNANAETNKIDTYDGKHYIITQKDIDHKEYKEPVYQGVIPSDIDKDLFKIELFGDPDNFPYSSIKQGSVFYQIFSDLVQKEHIYLYVYCTQKNHKDLVSFFEHGQNDVKGLFGVYFENIPYSKNEYFYPSFAENKIHLITSNHKKLDVRTKQDLKKYKGLYTKQDNLSSFVIKDMKNLGIQERNSFEEMYEELVTGKVDFVVASFYKSQIELYRLGLRNYVQLSRTPIWTIPMFMRFTPKMMSHPRMEYLKKYLKSSEYKQKRDKALDDMLLMYKENTKGIVPPTYMNTYQSPISFTTNN